MNLLGNVLLLLWKFLKQFQVYLNEIGETQATGCWGRARCKVRANHGNMIEVLLEAFPKLNTGTIN